MVAARQRVVVEALERRGPGVVLEVGCGIEMLGERVHAAGLPVEQWIIVEPNERFLHAARALKMGRTRVEVIHGFFEDSGEAVRRCWLRPPDFIVCSGVLNEIEEPAVILRAARALLAPAGTMHVNVPNAQSLHRKLAKAMGIIADEKQLTERNRQLAQFRVYDFEALTDLAAATGFRVVDRGGYFLKPFTHAQMEALGGLLSAAMLDGLWKLGRELPELASEIYVNLEAAA
jgi:2-polyprenyl-3-methyl-5-hydroxy-6-metoxy-1,4-benzoquinol methylase